MTDTLDIPNTSPEKTQAERIAQKRLAKRNAAERRFRFYGQAAIAIAVSFLVILIASIAVRAAPGFTKHYLTVERPPMMNAATLGEGQTLANITHLNDVIQADLRDTFPEAQTRSEQKSLSKFTSRLSVLPIVEQLETDPSPLQDATSFQVAISDDIDLYLKGGITGRTNLIAGQAGRLSQDTDGLYRLSDAGPDGFPDLKSRLDPIDINEISLLIRLDEAWFRTVEISGAVIKLEHLTGPRPVVGEQSSQPINAKILWQGPENRALTDLEIAWTEQLARQGRISQRFNWGIITNPDSNYPELAGAGAAIVGSLFTMIITALFALPIGVLAAIYLEEFARENVLTNIIEININNLAAVPSIIFGLLGAAVFLNVFGMPRSAPFVGGLVLGLLVLPTIIIASRAALKSIPPSIRTAALGLGASKTQTVFHHVLPLAAPGIFTGAIIAMARALGETAPLLLIGMVAFVNSVPTGPTEESTALPVLIFKWFNGAERAWDPMTSAVILILLAILIMMNLIAIILRRRFERRW